MNYYLCKSCRPMRVVPADMMVRGEKSRCKACNARRYHKKRKAVIKEYGGKCECCSLDVYEVLAIDHRKGDGHIDRLTRWSKQLVADLWKRKYVDNLPPNLEEYRILCHNCNGSYGRYGYCPHQSRGSLRKFTQEEEDLFSILGLCDELDDFERRFGLILPHNLTTNERARIEKFKMRFVVFKEIYDGKCENCGNTVLEFLTLDHINNDGGKLRKEGQTSANLYRNILNSGKRDPTLRPLCSNCNLGRSAHFKMPVIEGHAPILVERK